jgi:ABC-2 type transport system permease protein
MLLVVVTSVPLLFMTGISWPLSNMPGYWKSIAMIFPSTWGVRGFLSISSMGGSIEDIQDEIMILWFQAVLYFFITCAVYRYQINHTRKHANEKIMNVRAKAKEAMNRIDS